MLSLASQALIRPTFVSICLLPESLFETHVCRFEISRVIANVMDCSFPKIGSGWLLSSGLSHVQSPHVSSPHQACVRSTPWCTLGSWPLTLVATNVLVSHVPGLGAGCECERAKQCLNQISLQRQNPACRDTALILISLASFLTKISL